MFALKSRNSNLAALRVAFVMSVCTGLMLATPAGAWAQSASDGPFTKPVEKKPKPQPEPPDEKRSPLEKPVPTGDPKMSGDMQPRAQSIVFPEGLRVRQGGHHDIGGGAAEITSAVVPPGKKPQCPSGRLLISNDRFKNPGLITGFDLNALDVETLSVTPEALPSTSSDGVFSDLYIKSNDHDLVSLSSGDVVLLKKGQMKSALSPKPEWFDHTYIAWGNNMFWPGARGAMFIWQSKDCGESFALAEIIDFTTVDDGWGTPDDYSLGNPKRRPRDPNKQIEPLRTPPGSLCTPFWPTGGTDGPLAKADRLTDRVFLVMSAHTYQQDRDRKKPGYCSEDGSFFYIKDAPIQRTAVYMSQDSGETWEPATTLPYGYLWRLAVAPRKNNRLAFLPGRGLIHETRIGADIGQAQVQNPEHEGRDIQFNPLNGNWSEAMKDAAGGAVSRLQDHKLLTRSPDSDGLLFAVRETVPNNGGGGYGLYAVNQDGTGYLPFPQVAPTAGRNGFIFHLTPVDTGKGPILFYWYDVNPDKGTMIIRGRIIASDRTYTSDFNISGAFPIPAVSLLDYHTADGFATNPRTSPFSVGEPNRPRRASVVTFEYYPVWLQSDGNVHYAKITYSPPQNASAEGHHRLASNLEIRDIKPLRSRPKLKPSTYEALEVNE